MEEYLLYVCGICNRNWKYNCQFYFLSADNTYKTMCTVRGKYRAMTERKYFRNYLHLYERNWVRDGAYTRYTHACAVHPCLRVRVLTRGWVCFSFARSTYTHVCTHGRIHHAPPSVALSFIHNISTHKRAKVYVQPRPQRGWQHMHSLPPPPSFALVCMHTFLRERRATQWTTVGNCGLHFRRLHSRGNERFTRVARVVMSTSNFDVSNIPCDTHATYVTVNFRARRTLHTKPN